MTENTSKPTDNQQKETAADGQNRSVISRVKELLTRKERDVSQPTTPATPPPAPARENAQPAPPAGEQPASQSEEQPKRSPSKRSRRSRGGRGRSRGGKKNVDKPAVAGGAASPPKGEQPATKQQKKGEKPASGCKLLINTDEPEECRLALVENGKVESFHLETISQEQTKGNIYKGRITAVEANLQAAFVDYGTAKNGFLPFSDIHPEYYCKKVPEGTHWKDLRIQEMVKKGQEVLVEVVKEATGNKGASLTTYLSLPGRYLVLMPGSDSAGISRKIEEESQRQKLRQMMGSLKIPEGIGYIVRTASKEITKTSLSQDLRYLLNLWEDIKRRGQSKPAPALLYKEQDIISRFLRDHYTTSIKEIVVDAQEAYDQVQAFLKLLPPSQRRQTSVRLHQGTQPIFSQYHVEKQIEQIFQPTVPLPSGGSIVINPTEALVAIDVNSGRTSKDKDFEETIFLANMEAAEELARQLRLRDLGGLIVVDFIDMRDAKHTREVEKKVRECMKRDKAKVDFTRISKFGLMQISRQKMAAPIQTGSYKVCPYCQGRGLVRSVEALALMHLRHIQTGMSRRNVQRVACRLPIEVAQYILNRKRQELLELEKQYNAEILIEADPAMTPAESKIHFSRGN